MIDPKTGYGQDYQQRTINQGMALNYLKVSTTRRLAIALLAAAGALLFAALDLVGVGLSIDDRMFAAKISKSIGPLSASALMGLVALIWAEIAAHPDTPREGHPHSKINYLHSAFAVLIVFGLGSLLYGASRLIAAATIQQ